MKLAGILSAASVAAASSIAIYSGSDRNPMPPFENKGSSLLSSSKEKGSESHKDGGDDKFALRFDGLKFIETLVTAHR